MEGSKGPIGIADTVGGGAREGAADDPGEWLGRVVAARYALVAVLGSGGMGSVYLARDLELDELVALKMLRGAQAGSDEAAAALRREVVLARRITHRNVARTFDLGKHAGRQFLTMEYVEGETLSARLAQDGAIEPGRAVSILVAVCEALHAAHEASVVHGDVKPDNILLARDGRVVVTDFGLAHGWLDEDAPDAVAGTPQYMAPEQLHGRRVTSTRSDIYSLGAVAFEVLTGKRLWSGASPAEVAAQRMGTPEPDLETAAPHLAPALARVVRRAVSEAPADRYPTAALLAEALVGAEPSATRAPSLATVSPGHSPASANAKRAVAVLPLSRRGEVDAALVDGVTEELIDGLSEVARWNVLSFGAVSSLRDSKLPPHELGASLDVDTVVCGSIEHTGDAISLALRAIDCTSGFQLWTGRERAQTARVLSAGRTLVAGLAHALGVDATPGRGESLPTASAIELYMQARKAYRAMSTINEAVDCFEQALALAPDSGVITAGHAAALLRQCMLTPRGSAELLERARDAVQSALERAPELGWTHLARGYLALHTGDAPGAVRAICDALARAPSLADAHGILGGMLVEMGRVPEGQRRLRTARRLDPTLLGLGSELPRSAALMGDFTEVDRYQAQVSRSRPGAAGWIQPVRIAAYSGQRRRLEALIEPVQATPPDGFGTLRIVQALLDVYLERASPAVAYASLVMDPATTASTRRLCIGLQMRAEIAGFAADRDIAFEAIETADRAGLLDLLWLERCPLLASVRDDARYEPLHASVQTRAHAAYDAMWLTR